MDLSVYRARKDGIEGKHEFCLYTLLYAPVNTTQGRASFSSRAGMKADEEPNLFQKMRDVSWHHRYEHALVRPGPDCCAELVVVVVATGKRERSAVYEMAEKR